MPLVVLTSTQHVCVPRLVASHVTMRRPPVSNGPQTAPINGNSQSHEIKYHSSPSLYHRLTTNPYFVYPLTLALFLAFHLTFSYLFTGTIHYGLLPSSPPGPLTFSPAELRQYDGSDGSKPVYLAILGDVFDVSSGAKYYGPDGGYHAFAGRDGSRAFITGCFDEAGAVADVRGLTEQQMEALRRWRDFYAEHKTYRYVGKVQLPDIPADAPLPNDDCK